MKVGTVGGSVFVYIRIDGFTRLGIRVALRKRVGNDGVKRGECYIDWDFDFSSLRRFLLDVDFFLLLTVLINSYQQSPLHWHQRFVNSMLKRTYFYLWIEKKSILDIEQKN